MNRRKFLLASLLAPWGAHAQETFDEWKKDQKQDFSQYKQRVREAFQRYKQAHDKALKAYRAQIEDVWSTPELTGRRKWAEYGPDRENQKVVDFDTQEIRIKVVDHGSGDIEEQLFRNLTDLLGEDFATAFQRNPVDQQVEKALKKDPGVVKQGKPGEDLVLGHLFDTPYPDGRVIEAKARQLEEEGIRQKEEVNAGNGQAEVLSVPMEGGRSSPSNGDRKKSVKASSGRGWADRISVPVDEAEPMPNEAEPYLDAVRQQAAKHDLDPTLMLAVMHTESSFNPMARSHIPAYGLMQIVPESAGKDATRVLHGEPEVLPPSYLYEPQNNIEVGAVYLNLLYYHYVSDVQDVESRLYCAIASYNTGSGNVAKTFVSSGSMSEASKAINRRSSQEVYQHLVSELPYEEPRHYFQRVTRRMLAYRNL